MTARALGISSRACGAFAVREDLADGEGGAVHQLLLVLGVCTAQTVCGASERQ